MYEEILGMGEHTVRVATTAAEALTLVGSTPFDVVLLDLGIVGGADAVVEAARSRAGTRLVLASGARDLSERATALGAHAFLGKPFMPEDLLKTVQKVVGS